MLIIFSFFTKSESFKYAQNKGGQEKLKNSLIKTMLKSIQYAVVVNFIDSYSIPL